MSSVTIDKWHDVGLHCFYIVCQFQFYILCWKERCVPKIAAEGKCYWFLGLQKEFMTHMWEIKIQALVRLTDLLWIKQYKCTILMAYDRSTISIQDKLNHFGTTFSRSWKNCGNGDNKSYYQVQWFQLWNEWSCSYM